MKPIVPQTCRIIRNRAVDASGAFYSLTVTGFRAAKRVFPGHFVHIKVRDALDPFFRRAFSVADYDAASGKLEIIYKVVGKGTSILGGKKKGDHLDLLGPLGNHFATVSKRKTIVIVAGGIGFPPLYYLAARLIHSGHAGSKILFFYGARTRNELVEMRRIRKLGVEFIPCTDDGSYGQAGFVTAAVADRLETLDPQRTVVFACGPEAMLATLQDLALERGFSGEVSLEAPMPCGIGVCLGCIKPRRDNPRQYVRVCYDGPVFALGEVRM